MVLEETVSVKYVFACILPSLSKKFLGGVRVQDKRGGSCLDSLVPQDTGLLVLEPGRSHANQDGWSPQAWSFTKLSSHPVAPWSLQPPREVGGVGDGLPPFTGEA